MKNSKALTYRLFTVIFAVTLLDLTFGTVQPDDGTAEVCQRAGILFQTSTVDYRDGVAVIDEGGDVVIPCQYNFTKPRKQLPFWRMQHPGELKPTLFYHGAFPRNISYNESARLLEIKSVYMGMNGTSFACCFEFFDIQGICENPKEVLLLVSRETARGAGTRNAGLIYPSALYLIISQLFLTFA